MQEKWGNPSEAGERGLHPEQISRNGPLTRRSLCLPLHPEEQLGQVRLRRQDYKT